MSIVMLRIHKADSETGRLDDSTNGYFLTPGWAHCLPHSTQNLMKKQSRTVYSRWFFDTHAIPFIWRRQYCLLHNHTELPHCVVVLSFLKSVHWVQSTGNYLADFGPFGDDVKSSLNPRQLCNFLYWLWTWDDRPYKNTDTEHQNTALDQNTTFFFGKLKKRKKICWMDR